jgi:SAM-dependent methyltransferase
LSQPKGSIHVDIGAGIGSLSYLIARQGYHSIAIELDATNLAGGISLVRSLPVTENQSLQLWVANIFDLPLADRSVDFITIKEVLHHLADPAALFRELARVLKPGGLLYVWEPFWPSRATGPLRWLLVEELLRPRELAFGIHHVYYTLRDYRRMFRHAASKFEMHPVWKRGKWRHYISQNSIAFGEVEAVLTLGDTVPQPIPQRRQIEPDDFIISDYLPRSLQAGEQYASYLATLDDAGSDNLA